MLRDLKLPAKGIVYAGAHRGEHVPEMLACGFERVLLVEPNPGAAKFLQPFVSDRVRWVHAALDEHDGRVTYWAAPDGLDILNSIYEPAAPIASRASFAQKAVDAVTLGGLLATESGAFNVLYMNIQGAELATVRGAGAALDAFDVIACEVDFVERYRNAALYPDLERFLGTRGWVAVGLWRNPDPENDYGMACFARVSSL